MAKYAELPASNLPVYSDDSRQVIAINLRYTIACDGHVVTKEARYDIPEPFPVRELTTKMTPTYVAGLAATGLPAAAEAEMDALLGENAVV